MLIRHGEEMKTVLMEKMRGGKGIVTVRHLLNPDEMIGKGRLFAENILPPGASIGLHPHHGDVEAYYFIEGNGVYYNNDERFVVGPGDLTLVDDNDSHGIENTGDGMMRFIALILFTGENK